ncbi:AGAP009121-PA [Anopheles gambiae str. PEST]|uniref:AGAP009121-PA n=1 Tax=Anopheles gambiae TaxID=7165 RepID=Q7PW17_ANOGA|nr:AGAP009121-PA [Anopheles gambiae str. PEST]
MKLAVALLCLVAVAAAAPRSLQAKYGFPSGRVVGGIDALPGEFPSIVSIQRVILVVSTHICGGSILSNFWVLTAAHCITENPATANFAIWAGTHNTAITEDTRQVISVASSTVHPDYQGGVNPTDIAVMRLAAPLTFTPRIQPVVLPAPGSTPSGPATLAGWGSTGGTLPTLPNILQKVTKPIIPFEECRSAAGVDAPLGPTNVCTGPLTGGVSACSGDSGGPLYTVQNGQQVQVGIVSWGWIPCGTIGFPSVYVGVSHYIDWIQNNTN